MPVTVRHFPGADLPPNLQKEFNVKPHQLLKITVEVEEAGDFETSDTENVGDALIEGLKELIEAKKEGRELPNARDLLNSL